jgi:outer membrane protein assembly factor BamA
LRLYTIEVEVRVKTDVEDEGEIEVEVKVRDVEEEKGSVRLKFDIQQKQGRAVLISSSTESTGMVTNECQECNAPAELRQVEASGDLNIQKRK